MKDSKTLFMCAVMNLTALMFKIIVNMGESYPIHTGWATDFIFNIASVWLVINSHVKHKAALAVCGSVIVIAFVCILATMSLFGLVELQ